MATWPVTRTRTELNTHVLSPFLFFAPYFILYFFSIRQSRLIRAAFCCDTRGGITCDSTYTLRHQHAHSSLPLVSPFSLPLSHPIWRFQRILTQAKGSCHQDEVTRPSFSLFDLTIPSLARTSNQSVYNPPFASPASPIPIFLLHLYRCIFSPEILQCPVLSWPSPSKRPSQNWMTVV